jgi:hypothetical protein
MCAAGSGKTWGICNEALSVINTGGYDKRVLITTFTNKGVDTVNYEIAKQNQGVGCHEITVRSWFQFLMAELIKPYQTHIIGINEVKSFDFSDRYGQINYGRTGEIKRYFTGGKNVKKDFASELVVYLNQQSGGALINRLGQVYSHIFIDEIQDMAGDDLSIVEMLFDSNIAVTCVGDNKQATYRTHNTRKKKGKTGKNLWDFCADKAKDGIASIEENMVSRRFNSNICTFANCVFSNDNNISTCMADTTEHDGVFIIARESLDLYMNYFSPIVLKYDRRTSVGEIMSLNFGQCKGMTFDRVLIYPNKPLSDFIKGKELKSPEKYYVAVTRPRYSLAIVMDRLPTSTMFEAIDFEIAGKSINALRYIE